MQYVLGIDGGASKTLVWCSDLEGKVIGVGKSGPTNLTSIQLEEARINLKQAIDQATAALPQGWQIERSVFGLSGFDTPEEHQKAAETFDPIFDEIRVKARTIVNDTLIALRSGTDSSNAVVIVSGTGSNCFGKNDQNEVAHVGGMDFLLSDEGSGYAIGLAVLRAAVQSFDGRGPKSLLEEAVRKYFQIEKTSSLKSKVYHPLISKPEISELTVLCIKAQEEHDPAAQQIIDQAVSDLTQMVRTVMSRLRMAEKQFDCVVVGSVANLPIMKIRLGASLKDLSSGLIVVHPEYPPVLGAVKMALQQKE